MREAHRGRSRTGGFGEVSNPIAEELRDIEKAHARDPQIPVIPFFEDGDATLYFFDLLKKLSPTHGGIIQSIGDFVLGGEFTVERKKRGGFSRREDTPKEVTDQEFNDYVDYIESWIEGEELLSLAWRVYDNLKTSGNAFVEIAITTVQGEKFVELINHDATTCKYLATSKGNPKVILISADWRKDYTTKYPPTPVFLYPNFDTKEGVTRTILHLKNEVAGHEWYGLPDSVAAIYPAYSEVQRGEYGTRMYANDFTPRVFIETVDDFADEVEADEAGEEWDDAVDQVFTNKGGYSKRVLHRSRGINTEPALVEKIESSDDYRYQDVMSRINELDIFKAHNWHPALMLSIAGKLGSDSQFDSISRQKAHTVIKKLQKKIGGFLEKIIEVVTTECFESQSDLVSQFSIGLTDNFEAMLLADPTEDTTEEENTATATNGPNDEGIDADDPDLAELDDE